MRWRSMTLEELNERILHLENLREATNRANASLREDLTEKERQVRLLRDTINANIFENTEEYKELQELNIVKKWMETTPEQED